MARDIIKHERRRPREGVWFSGPQAKPNPKPPCPHDMEAICKALRDIGLAFLDLNEALDRGAAEPQRSPYKR
jgi:hypothetical protein